MLDLRIPKEIIEWIDERKGSMSRPVFIINKLYQLMKEDVAK